MAGAGAEAEQKARLCRVDVRFPFGYEFTGLAAGVLGGKLAEEYDFVIGMDLISMGDMAITHRDGKMYLSLRFPPDDLILFEQAGEKTAVL